MAISEELFMAILSMDAYNRGYKAGIEGLGGIGTSIGSAIIESQSNVASGSDEVAAGFYAVAYDRNGQTVISYRGTNADTAENFWADASNGYLVGAGYSTNDQAVLAADWSSEAEAIHGISRKLLDKEGC